jgi:hypothetical protein
MCLIPDTSAIAAHNHGWVVGVPINNPSSVTAWATTAIGGGIWGHGGVASDGTNMFVITWNTFNTGGNWLGGEAVIRLQAGPLFSGSPTDYWAPTNWLSLDNGDIDLGGCGAVLIDVPGATPSQPVLALGKNGNAYLLRRNNLGGITAPVASANVANFVAAKRLPLTAPVKEHILFFATRAARFPLIRLLRPIRQPYFLLGALARPARVRHGLQLLMGLIMRLYGWLAPRATSACTATMAILAQSSTQAVG